MRAVDLVFHAAGTNAVVVADGEHRLSRPEDLARLFSLVGRAVADWVRKAVRRGGPDLAQRSTIYDAAGVACNYPPSTLPLSCSGEITTAQIWLNQAIPAGSDIEARRVRLIQHELGHAMGLTRHAPTLDIAALARRYGWQ